MGVECPVLRLPQSGRVTAQAAQGARNRKCLQVQVTLLMVF